jgi:uncharacterized protein DUF3618
MSNYLNETRTDVPTTSDDPEVIRRDIEATRADLSRDVDTLTEKVSPARVMERKVDRAKGAVGSVKEKVMGSSNDPYDNGKVGGATDKASSMVSAVGDTAGSAPSVARSKTQGNPLAAGLIAFGVGWLASSLLPATDKEADAAGALKDKASEHSDTLTAPLKEAAQGAKENLSGPAQDAVSSMKSTATDAAGTVKDEAASAKDDVSGSAQDAKDAVQNNAS